MSQTGFYDPGLGAEIDFVADAQGKITQLILAIAEGETKAQRQ
jgi:hypothetical protein